MSVLCGTKEVPEKPGTFIKDRSVHPEFSQRDIALSYMTQLVEKMSFPVPVTVTNQNWVEEEVIILGNLIVTVQGTDITDKAIVVGAHYDVQNNLSNCWKGSGGKYLVTQGADDNTSGTVGCLALLRRFTKKPPKITTIVVCFDGEEPGEFNGLAIGSAHFVRNMKSLFSNLTIVSSVIADMIGASPTTPHGFVVATSNSVDDRSLQLQANEKLQIPTKVTILDNNSRLSCLNLSDSTHFARFDIPTVLLSYLGGYSSVPSFYHTERDTVDIINWKSFLEALDLFEFLASEPLPTKLPGASLTADPLLLAQLLEMGFPKDQCEFALIQTENNFDLAINLLM
jgi:hypothetical protein